jgi:hypothetical protein
MSSCRSWAWLCVALLMGLFGPPDALAQEDDAIEAIDDLEEIDPVEVGQGFDAQNLPRVDRVTNLLTARPIRPGAVLFSIDHRTRQSFLEGGEELYRDYLGLDAGGLKIGLAFRFGILDDLDVGLMRLNGTAEAFDSYELDARFRFLRQADHFVDAAVRAGITGFVHPGDIWAVGGFGQLLVDHVFADQLLFSLGVLFHSDSSNDVKSLDDPDWSLGVAAALEWRFLDWLAWTFELGANLAGYGSKWPVAATSIKVLTHRHSFSLVVTNNQYMMADGFVANTWRGAGDLIMGFQITREFNLW